MWWGALILLAWIGATGAPAAEIGFDFAYRISPLLAKTGCASAQCHGASTGKGGFKLSLFAENPEADYDAILRELDGRRVDLHNPTQSLFLRKPMRLGVRHGGGRLLDTEDFAYREFRDWIASEAPFRSGARQTLTGIRIERTNRQLSAIATFEIDGRSQDRDVTPWTLWESSAPNLVAVNAEGALHPHGLGVAWVFARFGGLSARWEFLHPWPTPAGTRPQSPSHPLDQVWVQRLEDLGLQPAPPAPPHTLLRRLSFDFLGRPPQLEELTQFESLNPETRAQSAVERLVEEPEFRNRLGQLLSAFFEVPPPEQDGRNDAARHQRLRAAFQRLAEQNASWFEIAERALTDPELDGIWRAPPDPRDRGETVGRTLLGVRLGCARCHNHPMDRWTNQDHLRFAAWFTDPRPGPDGALLPGKLFLPGSGVEVTPKLLPIGADRAEIAADDPRRVVAGFLRQNARRTVARNAANRFFGALMGAALVEPVDDHRLTNPTSHPDALDILTDAFLELEGAPKAFLPWIATSRWYAASSAPPTDAANDADAGALYRARRVARPLSPREWTRAIETALGVPLDLPTPPEAPLPRQLFQLNSGALESALRTPGNQVEALLFFEPDPRRQLRDLYRLILSRNPRAEEIAAFLPLLEGDRPQSMEAGFDLAFALFASREFGSLR